MPESRVLADDIFELCAAPFSILWVCFPSFLRKRITSIPREFFFILARIFWTLVFYYWLYTWVSPLVAVPTCVYSWANTTVSTYYVSIATLGSWYAALQVSLFQMLVPVVTFMSWILSWRQKPAVVEVDKPVIRKIVQKLSDVFYVPERATAIIPAAVTPTGEFIPERAIQGSPLTPCKELPTFVAFIHGINSDGSEDMVGVGFRAENAFITAAHNLTGYENVKIISNTAVVELSTSTFETFPFDDLAFAKMSDRDFSILGLSKGKLLDHAVTEAYPLMCQAFGPGTPASFTIGAVSQVANFGKVTYAGTTTSGFSGTPYIQHKNVVGMHLGAGMVNLGLDAAYIALKLSKKNESTEEWLMDSIAADVLNKREVKWERSPTAPDEIFVQRHGKYFIVDADMFFTTYEPQHMVSKGSKIADKLPVYSDSKNDVVASTLANADVGATGQTSVIRNCVQTPLSASCASTHTSTPSLEETSATGSPEQTPVVLNGRLNCTLNPISYQQERKRLRQKLREKKSKGSSHGYIPPGSAGLELIR